MVEYRNTSLGRQPFVEHAGMAVWEFIMVAQGFEMNAELTADYLQCPVEHVQAALEYYHAYPEEVDQAVEENDRGEERLKQLFPDMRVFALSVHDGEPSS